MKTFPILVASALIAALVLTPMAAAAGSITFTSPAAGASYKGTASYSITGAVSPVPTQPDNVFISVKNPSGVTVDAASVAVSLSTGSFTYATATGGSAAWVTGTYTITATDSYGATGTTTFAYTSTTVTPPTTGVFLTVQAEAATPDFAGQTVQVTALVSFSNGTNVAATWTGSHYHNPAGSPTVLSAPTNIGPGMYMWTISLPSNAANGLYTVMLKANSSGSIAWGDTGFTVNSALQPNTAVLQHDLNSNFTALSSAISNINTAISGVSSTLSSVQTTLGNVNTAVSNLSGLAGQLTTATSGINTTQTYVLVVAALAAITLVLELAILVRKIS